jgi:hypothetical protein
MSGPRQVLIWLVQKTLVCTNLILKIMQALHAQQHHGGFEWTNITLITLMLSDNDRAPP